MNVRGATAENTWSLYARDPLDSDREIGVGERIIQKLKKKLKTSKRQLIPQPPPLE